MGTVPTSTAFAILGLIAAREGSAYELAQRMARAHRLFYPRAQSHLYAEIKRLVSAGYAAAREERTGRRLRTTYRITRRGRRALTTWIGAPARPPVLEVEGLLRVAYAEFGSKPQLLRHLAAIRDHADQVLAVGAEFAFEFARRQPSPQLHTNRLVWEYLWGHYQMQAAWARDAIAEVERWPSSAASPPALARAHQFFREIATDLLHHAPAGERRATRSGAVLARRGSKRQTRSSNSKHGA
jgi:DNA-binding PadR family transcriptional regulator